MLLRCFPAPSINLFGLIKNRRILLKRVVSQSSLIENWNSLSRNALTCSLAWLSMRSAITQRSSLSETDKYTDKEQHSQPRRLSSVFPPCLGCLSILWLTPYWGKFELYVWWEKLLSRQVLLFGWSDESSGFELRCWVGFSPSCFLLSESYCSWECWLFWGAPVLFDLDGEGGVDFLLDESLIALWGERRTSSLWDTKSAKLIADVLSRMSIRIRRVRPLLPFRSSHIVLILILAPNSFWSSFAFNRSPSFFASWFSVVVFLIDALLNVLRFFFPLFLFTANWSSPGFYVPSPLIPRRTCHLPPFTFLGRLQVTWTVFAVTWMTLGFCFTPGTFFSSMLFASLRSVLRSMFSLRSITTITELSMTSNIDYLRCLYTCLFVGVVLRS